MHIFINVDYYIMQISSYIVKLCKSKVKTPWQKGRAILCVSLEGRGKTLDGKWELIGQAFNIR